MIKIINMLERTSWKTVHGPSACLHGFPGVSRNLGRHSQILWTWLVAISKASNEFLYIAERRKVCEKRDEFLYGYSLRFNLAVEPFRRNNEISTEIIRLVVDEFNPRGGNFSQVKGGVKQGSHPDESLSVVREANIVLSPHELGHRYTWPATKRFLSYQKISDCCATTDNHRWVWCRGQCDERTLNAWR